MEKVIISAERYQKDFGKTLVCANCEQLPDTAVVVVPKKSYLCEECFDNKCMVPVCTNPLKWKGICSSCYGSAIQLIKKKETTWEELASMGLCVLNEKPLTLAFRELKKQRQDKNDKANVRSGGQCAGRLLSD